jgi:hypothetical protein
VEEKWADKLLLLFRELEGMLKPAEEGQTGERKRKLSDTEGAESGPGLKKPMKEEDLPAPPSSAPPLDQKAQREQVIAYAIGKLDQMKATWQSNTQETSDPPKYTEWANAIESIRMAPPGVTVEALVANVRQWRGNAKDAWGV